MSDAWRYRLGFTYGNGGCTCAYQTRDNFGSSVVSFERGEVDCVSTLRNDGKLSSGCSTSFDGCFVNDVFDFVADFMSLRDFDASAHGSSVSEKFFGDSVGRFQWNDSSGRSSCGASLTRFLRFAGNFVLRVGGGFDAAHVAGSFDALHFVERFDFAAAVRVAAPEALAVCLAVSRWGRGHRVADDSVVASRWTRRGCIPHPAVLHHN